MEQLIIPKNERQAHEIARQIEEDFQNDGAQEEVDAPINWKFPLTINLYFF